MVDITPLIRSDRQVIQAYKNGVFKISNVLYDHAVIVFPDRVERWPVSAVQIIAPDTDDAGSGAMVEHGELTTGIQPVTLQHAEIDLLLLGTGIVMHMLQPALRDWFKTNHIRCEFMDTGAACRTYNVLMAEGRRVAAALLPSV